MAWAGVAAMIACAAMALARRWPHAARLSITGASVELLAYVGVPWPVVGVLALPLVARQVPWICPAFPWLRRGSFDRLTIGLVAAVVLSAGTALVLWVALLHPDLTALGSMIPAMPRWLLPFAGLGFAIANAIAEEAIYRGVVLDALDGVLGAGTLPAVLQAVAFGCFHFHGFPSGAVGVALAGIYGLMLAVIRRQSGGMLPAVVTHVFADIAIFAILATGK
jgi:membrane protease YdiL (CAAX protease family)